MLQTGSGRKKKMDEYLRLKLKKVLYLEINVSFGMHGLKLGYYVDTECVVSRV